MTLCSAIMPTRGRQALALQAVQCFAAQTYSDKEIVIIDDMEDRSFPNGVRDLLPFHIKAIYLLHPSRSIAEKRNLCCEYAKGEIICHVDSDDWSAPERLSDQVKRLEESGKAVSGYCSLLFHVEESGRCFKYVGHPNHDAIGTSLCFRKDWWKAHPFRPGIHDPNVGEDNLFMGEARNAGELISVDAGQMMVARIHGNSTSPHDLSGAQQSYRPVPLTALPQGFLA